MKIHPMKIAAFLVLSCTVDSTFGQSTCEALLRFGTFDKSKFKSEKDRARRHAARLCSTQHQEESSFDSAAANIGIPIEGIPVELGGSSKRGNFRAWFSHFCSSDVLSEDDSARLQQWSSTASKVLADAFNKCTTARGFHVWIEDLNDPSLFRLRAEFLTPDASISFVTAKFGFSGDISQCKPVGLDRLTNGLRIPNTLNTVCSRANPLQSIAIGVESSYSPTAGNLEVLAQKPEPPIPPTCPATITLDPDNYDIGNSYKVVVASLIRGLEHFGKVIMTEGNVNQSSWVQWKFSAPPKCQYRLVSEYVSLQSRPVLLTFDREEHPKELMDKIIGRRGGWFVEDAESHDQDVILTSSRTDHTLKISRNGWLPHIKKITLSLK
jgi:hypothetical protein